MTWIKATAPGPVFGPTAEEALADIAEAMEGCLDHEGDRHGEWAREALVAVLVKVDGIVLRYRLATAGRRPG